MDAGLRLHRQANPQGTQRGTHLARTPDKQLVDNTFKEMEGDRQLLLRATFELGVSQQHLEEREYGGMER